MTIKIQAIVEFMKNNLARKLTLDEIGKSVGLSRSHVCYLFKAEYDISPGQYLKILRMEKAREMLDNSFLNIKEIMAKVGIQDQSHFTRDFKRLYSVTPSEYREHRQAANSPENSTGEAK